MWLDKKDEKLSKYRGIIIAYAIDVEQFLTYAILKYFYRSGTERRKIFYNEILNTRLFSFEEKVKLFETIPTYKRLKKFDQIKGDLRYIQNIRNKLAHWHINKEKSMMTKIVIQNPLNRNQSLTIDDEFIKKFEEKTTGVILTFKI